MCGCNTVKFTCTDSTLGGCGLATPVLAYPFERDTSLDVTAVPDGRSKYYATVPNLGTYVLMVEDIVTLWKVYKVQLGGTVITTTEYAVSMSEAQCPETLTAEEWGFLSSSTSSEFSNPNNHYLECVSGEPSPPPSPPPPSPPANAGGGNNGDDDDAAGSDDGGNG